MDTTEPERLIKKNGALIIQLNVAMAFNGHSKIESID